jgi:anaerobic selenocysteine-containing dehydrogenase
MRYNRAALPTPADGRTDWQILYGLAQRIGRGLPGALSNRALALLAPFSSPERLIDLALRTGPYGHRHRLRGALSIGRVKRAEHGIDLGPLTPHLSSLLRTKDKRLRLAPAVMVAEAASLEAIAAEQEQALSHGFDLTLIGRRQVRSNNSWMHNSARLMKGPDRCTARLHPDDAGARGLAEGQLVRVTSAVGAIEVPLEITDEMRPGVVSIPHGFGHARAGVGWRRAAAHPGASVNDITDPAVVDRLTGNAALNAVPVRLEAVAAPQTGPARAASAAT